MQKGTVIKTPARVPVLASIVRSSFIWGRSLLTLMAIAAVSGSAAEPKVGARYPAELREEVDPVTGLRLRILTGAGHNDVKPYQTHPTWTADGEWIVFRSDRGGRPGQLFLVHERNGEIVQVTDDESWDVGSVTLSRHRAKAWLFRGGPKRGKEEPTGPRQLVEIDLQALLTASAAGRVGNGEAYQRVVATFTGEMERVGGLTVDANEEVAYGVINYNQSSVVPPKPTTPTAKTASERGALDDKNTDVSESREAARARFTEAGKGPAAIIRIDLSTGNWGEVVRTEFRLGHLQANPWVSGEMVYCHETGGDAPQRMWVVRADGSGNRPLYREAPEEWVTHETYSAPNEVMFLLMGHLPYLRERATGVAVVAVDTGEMKLLGQVEEVLARGGRGGFWHTNGSPDGRWAVADTFSGDVYLIDRATGARVKLTTGHVMKPDHTHPLFSPDGRRVLIQSGRWSGGTELDLVTVEVPGNP